jgi:glycosyltransferase 2 family protein
MLQFGSSHSGVQPASPGRAQRFLASWWMKWVAYGVAAACLTYVLWNLRLSDLRSGISHMIWWPVVLSILLQIVPRVVQAWRWGYLLRPIRVRVRHLLHAIYVSTLMNGILPLCPSDLVRGVMVARRTRTGTVRILSSQAVERAADGVALTLVVWLAMRGMRVPVAMDRALLALMAIVVVGMAIGLTLTLQHRRLLGYVAPRQPAGRLGKALKSASLEVLAGAKSVKAWTMPVSITTGLAMLLMSVVTIWLLLFAYHIDLSLLQAAALFGIISVGTLLPNAPASIGAWQFFCIMGLGLMGVNATHAAGFSLIAFAILTVPSLLLGAVALIVSPMSWAELRGGRASVEMETGGNAGDGERPAAPADPVARAGSAARVEPALRAEPAALS